MNDYSSTINSPGLLKKVYRSGKPKGPVAQMSENMPMMEVLRKKRDSLKTR